MSEYRLWKRDGVVGTYLVEVEAGDPDTDERVRVRPVYHTWYPDRQPTSRPRARWVNARRLRQLSDHDREVLAGRPLFSTAEETR